MIDEPIAYWWIPTPEHIAWPRTKGSLSREGDRLVDTPQSRAWIAHVAAGVRADLDRAVGGWEPIEPPQEVGGVVIVHAPFEDVTAPRAGDVDKHLRLVLDALTRARLWVDDRQANGWTEWKRTATLTKGPGVEIWAWKTSWRTHLAASGSPGRL